jgi:hypothetical protein
MAFKVALSITLIGFLLWNASLSSIGAYLAGLGPGSVTAYLGLLLVQLVLGAARWNAALRAITTPLPFAQAFAFFSMGAFFSQVLPGSVSGDAVRIYKVHRAGQRLGLAVNGVMLERVATVFALILLVAAMQPWMLSRFGDQVPTWTVPVLTVGAVAAVLLLTTLDRLPQSLRHWRVLRGLAALGADTRRLFLRPFPAAHVLGLAVVGHVNVSVAVYVLAVAMDLPVSVFDCIFLVPPVILVTTIPISIAGWGVREGAMVAAFGLIGVPAEGALALSVMLGLGALVGSWPGAVLWVLEGARRRRMVLSSAPDD